MKGHEPDEDEEVYYGRADDDPSDLEDLIVCEEDAQRSLAKHRSMLCPVPPHRLPTWLSDLG